MAPKKGKKTADAPEMKSIQLLGRAKNSLSMGLVGLPNVGKSLTFNILTKLEVPSENYPFCTKDPNNARVAVPDKRFNWLCSHYKPKSEVPAHLDVTDIAGLVRGAHEGLGLGNAFLSHIRAVDGIFHVVRIFDDITIGHVEGDVDPTRDLKIITNELIAKDLQVLQGRIVDCAKKVKMGVDKLAKEVFPILKKIEEVLESGADLRGQRWDCKEIAVINELQLLSAKPVVYLLNMSESDYLRQGNKHLNRTVEWIKARNPSDVILPFSAKFEANLMEMSPAQRDAYLAENKTQTMFSKIIRTGYKALHLINYFTVGPDEVRCWTIRKFTKAPDAAAVIHTDFRDHFVRAEVMRYKDLKKLKSEVDVRSEGKLTTEGKEYVVQDGDILHIKHNARGGGKKRRK
eukprot:gnl/Dysnectes_brevis/659_a727_4765.p1 GENE.gnl/Dysnectes_brevis/659_a727_4765~~gnl/Dysnectes_brevis/659_a727_4765.p1  ORF type:complete len:402 (+),score=163.61 gnl/Dysnectes_brevis/659_a727_4765:210-1415(+)